MPTRSLARRRCGLRFVRIGRCSAFAGLWTPWRGVRGPKNAPVEGLHELYGILTTDANAVVAPIHPKAMPVILIGPEEVDLWLESETPAALELQRALPDDALSIVAKGEKEDGAVASVQARLL
jgi:putative SOS response-associated peptidase YedK